jgi:hypothetical protein
MPVCNTAYSKEHELFLDLRKHRARTDKDKIRDMRFDLLKPPSRLALRDPPQTGDFDKTVFDFGHNPRRHSDPLGMPTMVISRQDLRKLPLLLFVYRIKLLRKSLGNLFKREATFLRDDFDVFTELV